MKKLISLFFILSSFVVSAQKFENLALTPPMGWNSWNKFGCNVSEKLIKEMADAFVANGMKDAGYEYIVIDDCWQVARDAEGNILADKERFPSGIKALADYIHSKGLKFGIYSDAGTKTCAGRPGSLNYEEKDAKQYAAWGIDYLKYDFCNTEGVKAQDVYPKMSEALRASGRPIVFSMCEWGTNSPWYWAKDVGHLWRTTSDIQDCWDCVRDWNGRGWVLILDEQEGLEKFAGPGHWNDPDMLEVGNGGMKENEYRAHFSFWCLLAAPLMAGNDLRIMPQAIKDILLNKEAIAIDQDKLGIQGSKKLDEGSFEVWTKPLEDGDVAVILFNRGEKPINADVKWIDFGIKGIFTAHDLWKKSDLGNSTGFTGSLPSHDIVFLRLTKQYCQKAVSFKPGQLWPDNNGVHINAHGGGILYYNDTYYWFGEHKIESEKGNFAQVGVHCYSSKDLYNWTDEGISLKVEDDPKSEITKGCILERPKVVYNKKTGQFVMWFHLERLGYGYGYASSGIAISDKVTGPYRFLRSVRPNQEQWPINVKEIHKKPVDPKVLETKYPGDNLFGDADSVNILGRDFQKGQMARDMTIFVDDNGKAYQIFASEENSTIHISELSDDYLSYTGKYARVFVGRFMEGPAIFKKDGKYYFIGSGCTSWDPNAARSAVADNIFGPWTELGNPCIGADSALTFHSQSTYVLPVEGKKNAFIFMADKWTPKNAIDGRYIWLPINFKNNKIELKWLDEWYLSYFDKYN